MVMMGVIMMIVMIVMVILIVMVMVVVVVVMDGDGVEVRDGGRDGEAENDGNYSTRL